MTKRKFMPSFLDELLDITLFNALTHPKILTWKCERNVSSNICYW